MNYIKLINAFYDRLETNPLSTSAIALWHALVHVNNKAGWQREFSVAVSVLCIKTGLSPRTINDARNALKIKGFIDFRSRKGNQAAIYTLVDLSATIADKPADSSSDKPIPSKEEEKELNAFQFYEQEGFGTISGFTAERLGSLIDDFGEASLIAAMQESVLHGARNLKYVEAILINPNKNSKEKRRGKVQNAKKNESTGALLEKYDFGTRFG